MMRLCSAARDFRRMGVQIIFLNEAGLTFEVPEVSAALLIVGVVLVCAIAYLGVSHLK